MVSVLLLVHPIVSGSKVLVVYIEAACAYLKWPVLSLCQSLKCLVVEDCLPMYRCVERQLWWVIIGS